MTCQYFNSRICDRHSARGAGARNDPSGQGCEQDGGTPSFQVPLKFEFIDGYVVRSLFVLSFLMYRLK